MPKLGKADKKRKVSIWEARRRKELALAGIRQLEFGEKSGKLVKVEEVRDAVAQMILAARNKFVVIGDELSHRLAVETDPVKCREIVDERVFAALAELKGRAPDPARQPRKKTPPRKTRR